MEVFGGVVDLIVIVSSLVVIGCCLKAIQIMRSVRRKKKVPDVFVPLLEVKDKDIWPPLTFLIPCVLCGVPVHWTETQPFPGQNFHRCPKKVVGWV